MFLIQRVLPIEFHNRDVIYLPLPVKAYRHDDAESLIAQINTDDRAWFLYWTTDTPEPGLKLENARQVMDLFAEHICFICEVDCREIERTTLRPVRGVRGNPADDSIDVHVFLDSAVPKDCLKPGFPLLEYVQTTLIS